MKAVPNVAPISTATAQPTPQPTQEPTLNGEVAPYSAYLAAAQGAPVRGTLPPHTVYSTYPGGVELTSGPLETEIDVISNGETDGYIWEIFTIHGKPDQRYTRDVDEVALKEKIDKVLAEKASWWGGLFR